MRALGNQIYSMLTKMYQASKEVQQEFSKLPIMEKSFIQIKGPRSIGHTKALELFLNHEVENALIVVNSLRQIRMTKERIDRTRGHEFITRTDLIDQKYGEIRPILIFHNCPVPQYEDLYALDTSKDYFIIELG